MAIEGDLREVSLADICQLLAMGRKTGCLTVTDRTNFGYVHFDTGRVAHASVLDRPDRLGELLVRNNLIDRGELSAAMETQARQPGMRLGRILVERGSVTPEQLERFVTVQIEEAVYHLFTWEQGTFQFEPGPLPDEVTPGRTSISAESLLLEGARRVDELSVIQKKVPSLDLVFAVERVPEEEKDVTLTEAQIRIVSLLDGERTLEDVVDESGLVEFDVVKAVYGMLQAGFLKPAGRRVGEGDATGEDGLRQRLDLGDAFFRAGMLEDAEREYKTVIERAPGSPVARARLAHIALGSRRPEDALRHLDAAFEAGNESAEHLRSRAVALERLRRYPEALAALDRATELRPEQARLLLDRGILLLKNREPRSALGVFQKFRKAIGGTGTPEPIFFAYALLAAAAAGKLDEAVALGREGLSLYPASGPILVNLGVVLEQRGDADAAQAVYLRAVDASSPLPQAHKNLGDLAYRRGDQASARAHYERAIRLNPALGDDLYLKLGTLAYKEGDRDWALELWRKALELNPGNEIARTNLDLVSAVPGR